MVWKYRAFKFWINDSLLICITIPSLLSTLKLSNIPNSINSLLRFPFWHKRIWAGKRTTKNAQIRINFITFTFMFKPTCWNFWKCLYSKNNFQWRESLHLFAHLFSYYFSLIIVCKFYAKNYRLVVGILSKVKGLIFTEFQIISMVILKYKCHSGSNVISI